ncbi:hypothetical protein GCG21_08525 [Pseudactinotalea sp. HY160]|uniref:hypothetical protein n=1 Tax=Pseudactinotalea sp. HY160 TaxID=2654490 RepID=UPI00128C0AA6|nr:hypothetical protein [Pseudactinotalea sp. HY160]MPV50048.1 hypothetical protein [Pseudactinotalea sp. HY160]
MTDQTTPTSRFALFEQSWRRKARDQGSPIERLAMPSVLYPAISRPDPMFSGPDFLFVSRKGGKLYVSDLLVDRPHPVVADLARVAERFYSANTEQDRDRRPKYTPGGVIVAPDRPTADFLVRKADRSEDAGTLASSLMLADALPASSRFVVLTEALARKFFLPAALDEDSLEDWMEAFGMRRTRTFANLRSLLLMVYRGPGGLDAQDRHLPDAEPNMGSVSRPAAVSESYLMGASRGRSLEGQCSQFSTVTSITNRWDFLVNSDPLGRRAAELDGRVFTAQSGISPTTLQVTSPFVAREGKAIIALPQHRPVGPRDLSDTLTVEEIAVSPDGTTEIRINHRSAHVVAGGQPVQFIAAPFMPSYMGAPGKKWTARESEGTVTAPVRQVPLAITLAGAPTAPVAAAA